MSEQDHDLVPSTRVLPTIRQSILDTYTLQLEDEVRSLRRRRRFWEAMFWGMTVLALTAVGESLWLIGRPPT